MEWLELPPPPPRRRVLRLISIPMLCYGMVCMVCMYGMLWYAQLGVKFTRGCETHAMRCDAVRCGAIQR